MKTTIFATLGSIIAITIFIALVFIYDGIFNVATAWEDPSIIRWALVTTRENSIKKRAAHIVSPAIDSNEKINSGFRSYREMCAICHTPPGLTDSPIAKGLNPAASKLAKSAERMSAAELFWTVKNGIRMTGMPAWGPTHSDKELWDIVAFLKKLPTLNKEGYALMDGSQATGHSHTNVSAGHGGVDSKNEDRSSVSNRHDYQHSH